MRNRGGGCLVAAALVLALVLVGLGATLVVLVSSPGSAPAAGPAPGQGSPELTDRGFASYAWPELAEVSARIAAAPSAEEAVRVAAECGVRVGDARAVTLDDGTQVTLTVAGLCHDERADGSGRAGITLVTSPIALGVLGHDGGALEGWESSALRAWLATEGLGLLPDDLAALVAPVTKTTENRPAAYASTDPFLALGETADALWLLSASEVCGPVTWVSDEYGSVPNANTDYVDHTAYDAVLSAEGEQYELFSARGVSGARDAFPALAAEIGGSPCAWWLRSAYPFTYDGSPERLCYQVSATGVPGTLASAASEAGVVAGLCI